jgi:hypothetical protein
MHSAVLQNKNYIRFAERCTVEVIAVSRIEQGVEKKDPRAATYEDRDEAGRPVEYLLEFPGLTLDEMIALNRSPASRYNRTGKIPYTAIVDPHTLEPVREWSGGQSAKTIEEAATDVLRQLARDHGGGVDRREYRGFLEDEKAARADAGEGSFRKALRRLEPYERKSEKWPQGLRTRLEGVRRELLEVAAAAVRRAETEAAEDPDGSRAKLRSLLRELRGTELAPRIEAALESIG